MPSFGGTSIFGDNVKMATALNPVERQENPFPGLSGVQSLPMGQRGGVTIALGLLTGSTAPNYAVAEALFFSFYDGLAYDLIDTLGRTWANVVLDSFEPQGDRIRQSPSGVYFREYVARFKHLTNS